MQLAVSEIEDMSFYILTHENVHECVILIYRAWIFPELPVIAPVLHKLFIVTTRLSGLQLHIYSG